ncbi:hypothetical protein [Variovorax terrae]|uniref:Uncharacterized protein n=1 Tax=Variovorax terrae TaxID=2923278 RepID=A0A9X1VWR4_9BURK|nr:hypothetical protein [Variovorax terrae]MCJ0763484.1 hypothetical protein [Variovorax terrae]
MKKCYATQPLLQKCLDRVIGTPGSCHPSRSVWRTSWTSPSAGTANAPSPDRGFKFWLSCLAVVAVLLGLALAVGYPKELPKNPQVSALAVMAPSPPKTMAQDAMPDAPMPVDLYRFALNALLVPLLDDSEPPRWTDAVIHYGCDPGTSVMVDGEPMVAGKLMPASAFTVRWNMDRCALMGLESVDLSGSVELLVFHEDAGLGAIVMPDRLRVDSHMGQTWLHGPFTAATSLAKSVTRP